MSEERPLTEFSSADDANTRGDGDTETVDRRLPDDDRATVEPATVTYRFRPNGAVCGRCGASTDRQWLDDTEFVCSDCKPWA